jgi:uncharacterized protein YukE
MYIKASSGSLDSLKADLDARASEYTAVLDGMYGDKASLSGGWTSDISAAAHGAVDQKLIEAGRALNDLLMKMGGAVAEYHAQMAENERRAASVWSI